eukprot:6531978-Alexandrium_andersonii.AAC.1
MGSGRLCRSGQAFEPRGGRRRRGLVRKANDSNGVRHRVRGPWRQNFLGGACARASRTDWRGSRRRQTWRDSY